MRLSLLHVILFFGTFILFLNFYNNSLLWDEVVFLSNAKAFIGESNYMENFRPPLIPMLIGFIWNFSGKSILVAKLIAIIFSLLSIYVFHEICKLYFKKPLHPTLLFALSPIIVYWSFRIYTDIPSMFFILLSFYFLKRKNYFLSGISNGLGFLSRFTASIFGLSIILSLLMKKRFNDMKKYLIGLLILIPWLIYNQITYGNPIYDFFMDYSLTTAWTQPYKQPLVNHLVNLVEVFSFLLPFLLIGCINFLKKEKEPLILFYMILSLFFLSNMNLKFSRYFIMILPFLYLFIYEGIRSFRYKKIALILVILSVAISSMAIFKIFEGEIMCWPTTKEAINYISESVRKNETIISNFWPYFGFFTNSTVYSNYADIDLLIEKHHPKFLVFRHEEMMPTPENLNFKKEKTIKGMCGDILIYKVET